MILIVVRLNLKTPSCTNDIVALSFSLSLFDDSVLQGQV